MEVLRELGFVVPKMVIESDVGSAFVSVPLENIKLFSSVNCFTSDRALDLG